MRTSFRMEISWGSERISGRCRRSAGRRHGQNGVEFGDAAKQDVTSIAGLGKFHFL
jgi:hypothetical protein